MIPLFNLPPHVSCHVCDTPGCMAEIECDRKKPLIRRGTKVEIEQWYYRCPNTGRTFHTQESVEFLFDEYLGPDYNAAAAIRRNNLIANAWGIVVVIAVCLLAYFLRH